MEEDKKSWFSRVFKKEDKVEKAAEQPAPQAAPTVSPEAVPERAPAPTQSAADTPAPAPSPVPDPIPVTESVSVQPAPAGDTEPKAEKPLEVSKEVAAAANVAPTDIPPAPEPTAPEPTVPEAQKTWYEKLADGLKKSASAISDGIGSIFTKRKLDDDTLEELEDLLITTDLGVGVAAKLTEALAKGRYNKEISPEEIKSVLAAEIEAIVAPVAKPLDMGRNLKPHVILMTGVNGAGKTTTIGKLAKQFQAQGKSVMLAAADTFRAAAIEQLKVWGERAKVPVIAKTQGADAAAVAFEAMERAIADGVDVLMIDTAGRLQNRDELMAELSKIVRVIERKLPDAPHDTLIVLDATTGQNAVMQVEAFQTAAKVSGLIMTKLDGSARGGVLVACADKFGLPIHAIGVGEGIDDLQAFNAKDYAASLVGLGR